MITEVLACEVRPGDRIRTASGNLYDVISLDPEQTEMAEIDGVTPDGGLFHLSYSRDAVFELVRRIEA